MNLSTFYMHSYSFPPVMTYPQRDDYSDSYYNQPSVSWDNFDWGYSSGLSCSRSDPGHHYQDFYPSQSHIDYSSSFLHGQPSTIYNQEGYPDPYPSPEYTTFRSPSPYEQPERTYYQGGYYKPQFINSSGQIPNPHNPEPNRLVQVNQVQEKVLANLRNSMQSLEAWPIPYNKELEPLIEMIDDLNKYLSDWLQDVKDKDPGEFLLRKLSKLTMRFVVALVQSWDDSQDESPSGEPMSEPTQAPVGGDTCYEPEQIDLEQPIKNDMISSPVIPEPGYEETYVSMDQKVMDDFGMYINTDLDFFDSEDEESICEVSREFIEHDFCETTGPKESDRSYDGPITEETDLVGSSMADLDPCIKDSIQSLDAQLDPLEFTDDSIFEITGPKSILIQPYLLDLEILDGVINIQEVLQFDILKEDRSWEILIWEVNFGGSERSSLRVPINLKPSNQGPYDNCSEDVQPKHTFIGYPFDLDFSVTELFGLGLHLHKSQAHPHLHTDFKF